MRYTIKLLLILQVIAALGFGAYYRWYYEPSTRQERGRSILSSTDGVSITYRGVEHERLSKDYDVKSFVLHWKSEADVPWHAVGMFPNLKIVDLRGPVRSQDWVELHRYQPFLQDLLVVPESPLQLSLEDIARFEELESLRIGWYSINPGSEPYEIQVSHFDSLPRLSRLHTLTITSDSLDDEALRLIGQVKSLRTLLVSSRNISAEGIMHFRSLKNLERLSISNRRTRTGVAPADSSLLHHSVGTTSAANDSRLGRAIRSFSHLHSLEVINAPVGDAFLTEIKDMDSLRNLTLMGLDVTDQGVVQLTSLNLTSITTDAITDNQGLKLLEIPTLEYFDSWNWLPDDVERELKRRRESR